MSVYAILKGKSIILEDVSISHSQGKITTFDISLPLASLIDIGNPYLEEIVVYDDGVEIINGFIRTPNLTPEFQEGVMSPGTAKLQCDTLIGLLQCEAAILVHFQDIPISTAIGTLLDGTVDTTWELNDVSTLDDIEITVDVRNKKTIWSQITAVMELAGSPTYPRYGGKLEDGTHLLDIGSFGEEILSQRAVLGSNLTSVPRFKSATREPLKRVYPVSGKAGETVVDLLDALNIDPSLSDPSQDFQIINDPDGAYIQNNLIEKGCSSREQYDGIKTENNEPPTQTELNETALALYRKAVRDMGQSLPYFNVEVQVALDKPPVEHSSMLFDGVVYNEDYNHYTEQRTLREAFSLRQWMRITGYKASLVEGRFLADLYTEQLNEKFVFDVSLTTADDKDTYDATEIVSKKAQDNQLYDQQTAELPPVTFFGVTPVTVTHSGVRGDCFQPGELLGRLFTFKAPVAPAGATNAIVTIKSISNTTVIAQPVQFGDLGVDAIYCVSGPNGGWWTTNTSVTMTVQWAFTS